MSKAGYRFINGVLFALILLLILLLSLNMCAGSVSKGGSPQRVKDKLLPQGEGVRVEPWVSGLEIPWSLVFLPANKSADKSANKSGSRALVSERPGRIRLIRDGRLQPEPYAILDAAHTGEAGLMGLAVHPNFPEKPYIYAMHTYKKAGKLQNRVVRLRDEGGKGTFDRVILDNMPGGRFHDGGRIAFGPDGMLYITLGETGDADLAQDPGSLGGKILRITPEGEIPSDNPFKGSPVYSLGHRNPQGLAWHPETKALFSSEHGPSGEFGLFARDEINVIKKGANYGWPKAVGAAKSNSPAAFEADTSAFEDPLVMWEDTTPPSGMAFYKGQLLKHLSGDLFVDTLRSEALIRIKLSLEGDKYRVVAIERWFKDKFGRLRDVVAGPDGALYFLTNNLDGRGESRPGDDRIYRMTPKL